MSSGDLPSQSLSSINSATLGTHVPIITLPDGQQVPTGTVASLLVNIRAYDELVDQESNVNDVKKKELEVKIAASLPILKKVGMFLLFTPDEWIRGSSPGRRFVGELALKEGV